MFPRKVKFPEFVIPDMPTIHVGTIRRNPLDSMTRRFFTCPICDERGLLSLEDHFSASVDPEHVVHSVMES